MDGAANGAARCAICKSIICNRAVRSVMTRRRISSPYVSDVTDELMVKGIFDLHADLGLSAHLPKMDPNRKSYGHLTSSGLVIRKHIWGRNHCGASRYRDNLNQRLAIDRRDGGTTMKGVVLAGGTGSRLNPLTRVTNKHLLPIFDKPMVYYPIQTLVNAGIEEILLVTGGKNAGDYLRLLGNGRDFGLKHLNYTYQEGEGGIAEALGLAEFFAAGEPICVILGDNIIESNVRQAV